MSLKKYKTKRNLRTSSEPQAIKKRSTSKSLHFCVQKHAARHLHYDLRLECQGVLLSWAIPKGPSLNPKDKRLAIHVEDHPLEYQYFEGEIPPGHYGAGTVEIWDKGYYSVPDTTSRKEQEKKIKEGLEKGHLDLIFQGTKLKGAYVLQKLKTDSSDKAWLLIKKADSYASSIEDPPLSPPKIKMPERITPMLATLVPQPFNDDDWLFEIKWDGYRALAFISKGQVQLTSRNQLNWNKKFPAIIEDLKKIKEPVILDGELVILDSMGKSDFQLMQNYQKSGQGSLFYYVFDILYKDKHDLRELPLLERKSLLKKLLNKYLLPHIRFSDHIIKKGIPFFKLAVKNKLEGIVGKKASSPYQSRRSKDWVKIKTTNRQEVVIGGFTAPRGGRKNFGALLVGYYNENNELIYCGHVGGGFDTSLLKDIHDQLKPLIQKRCPFKVTPKPNALATWVKPHLVCEVSFAEWTKDNIMRQPIFHGIRKDKPSKSVKKEMPQSSSKNDLTLTNLEKVYWPKEGYTKGDLIEYYRQIAPVILPYLKDRPVMLHRFPEGIADKNFYQKDIGLSHPNWIKTCSIKHEDKQMEYLVINDLNSLLYAVNLGSIELHPLLARCQHLEFPDYCVIDLDPHGISFKHVIETALVAHDILEESGIKHYCKTSGSKGLHICIPLHANYTFDQSRQFAEVIGHCIHQKLPKTTSLERNPGKRQKKIYLDCLQNRFGQTLICPYAVRPKPNATVSAPLSWEEVNDALEITQFTIETMPERLKKKKDLFKPVLGRGINMETCLKRLQNFIL